MLDALLIGRVGTSFARAEEEDEEDEEDGEFFEDFVELLLLASKLSHRESLCSQLRARRTSVESFDDEGSSRLCESAKRTRFVFFGFVEQSALAGEPVVVISSVLLLQEESWRESAKGEELSRSCESELVVWCRATCRWVEGGWPAGGKGASGSDSCDCGRDSRCGGVTRLSKGLPDGAAFEFLLVAAAEILVEEGFSSTNSGSEETLQRLSPRRAGCCSEDVLSDGDEVGVMEGSRRGMLGGVGLRDGEADEVFAVLGEEKEEAFREVELSRRNEGE